LGFSYKNVRSRVGESSKVVSGKLAEKAEEPITPLTPLNSTKTQLINTM
jgi:hypothetical protein